jgi:hypothetical protein
MRWDNLAAKVVVGPEMLKEMEEKMAKIKKNLKDAQEKKKHYVYKGRTHREFKVGDNVFLKVKAKRISLTLGNVSKLVAYYYGPLEIL